MARAPVHVGILASGRGSNALALIRAVERGYITGAVIDVLLSDKPDARALSMAEEHGVRTRLLEPASGQTREEYDARLLSALEECGVAPGKNPLVALAGFMRILSPSFVGRFSGRMMNIHPSLLPAFPGLRAQEQALKRGVKVAGCTVHFVVPDVDAGPIIVQKAVLVREGDDLDALSARILRQEHRIYPLAVKLYVEGRLRLQGGRVAVG